MLNDDFERDGRLTRLEEAWGRGATAHALYRMLTRKAWRPITAVALRDFAEDVAPVVGIPAYMLAGEDSAEAFAAARMQDTAPLLLVRSLTIDLQTLDLLARGVRP